ncbi:putative leucine-rich repeat domain, L domain-containing protein [Medicago truncatula]|uniref:Putative leucine-rich repeat domain, L domain-containing protein n=1 Tax=Medicago truncatula TaxID=3880 RepID=A0A396J2A1_MEDTR|nr:putative leucine-rich repeat domain, L domain-containing protein [Medicago truncatula]
MKMKRASLKYSQQIVSCTKSTMVATDFYLPDDCWEYVKFLIMVGYRLHLNFVSVVSKRFLSITNRLRFSLAIYGITYPFLTRLFLRFTNLTSLNLTCYSFDLNNLLFEISRFPLKLTSLNISNKSIIPTNGLRAFSENITTLTSLTCSHISCINSTDLLVIAECFPLFEELDLSSPLECNNDQLLDEVERVSLVITTSGLISLVITTSTTNCFSTCSKILSFSRWPSGFAAMVPQLKSLQLDHNPWLRDESIIMIASIFPNLQLLDLTHCYEISEGICQVLKRCCKIRHLKLAYCSKLKLLGMNFEAPKLEVLDLSNTMVDDETLYVISKSCCGLLQLLLKNCYHVTEKGVKHVVEKCTKLREINLKGCFKVHANFVASMIFSRPSLREITAPPGFDSSEKMKFYLSHNCFVW